MYQDSVYEGYLTKSPPKMNRRWQRRYFVLLPNKQLLYFSKLGGGLKGTIDLSLLQEVLFDLYLDKGPSNVMSLDVKGTPELSPKNRGCQDRIFYLLADSREEMETWHGHIMEVADLQLCRKKNVVADSPQGEEYYISARRKTAIRKEEESDKRGLAQSLATDVGVGAEFGTYQTSAELSQSMQANNFALYDVNHAKILTDITISQGEESSSEDESFTSPSSPEKVRRPKSPLVKRGMSLRVTDSDNRQTQTSYSSVTRSHNSLPLLIDEETRETCPPIPAHRADHYPQSVDLSPPLPPQRDSSRSKLALLSGAAPSPEEQRGVTRERKARTARLPCKSMIQDSTLIGGSQKRPAAKLPSIPLDVLMTQVKEVPTQTPVPRPRRPTSSSSSSSLPIDLVTDPLTSPTAITPYKTVQRASDLYPDPYPSDPPDPSYVNVDTSHGIYVKYDPGPSEPGEGTYVSISRDPIPLEKLATATDASGYTKIVEPKPRGKLAVPDENNTSSEANCK